MTRQLIFTAALMLAPLAAAAPAAAQSQGECPTRASVFGTVTSVTPTFFDLRTLETREGTIRVLASGARINTNGLALRPGVFVGAYGCYRRDEAFRADELTLSTNANTYDGYRRYVVTLDGTVAEVRGNRALLDTYSRHGRVWVYNTNGDLRVGERVSFRGSFDPRDAAFIATAERPY